MRIGVFDSGVGGLSVLKSLLAARAFEEVIYFGDTARVPYGNKDPETIIRYSLEALEFFRQFKLDLIIIACNTVSAYALDVLQQNSDTKILGVIEPGVLALENQVPNLEAAILVIGTKATIASQQYAKRLSAKGYSHIQSLATGLFVPLVEEGIFSGEPLVATMKYYFDSLAVMPEAIILGCTHFPLISETIRGYFNHKPLLIHSGDAIVEYLGQHHALLHTSTTEVQYFASDNLPALKATAALWLSA